MGEFAQDEVFQTIRFQIHQLYESVAATEVRKGKQWNEDAAILRTYITALSATRKILQKEHAEALEKMNQQSKAQTLAAQEREEAPSSEELMERLNGFRKKMKDIDLEMTRISQELNNEERSSERYLLEDQITVIRDTKQLCLEEIRSLEDGLKRSQAAEAWKNKQQADWTELARLKDQLTKIEVKIDQAKRSLLFPFVHGYKFRAGSSGVYIGAKDLYLSDFSAGVSLSVESMERLENGEKVAAIRLCMGGHETTKAANIPKADIDSGDEGASSAISEESKIQPSISSSSLLTDMSPNHLEDIDPIQSRHRASSSSFTDTYEMGPSPLTHPTPLLSTEWNLTTDNESLEGVDPPSPLSPPIKAQEESLQQQTSAGKKFAAKLLKRIPDKEVLQQKVARASQALRRVGSRRLKSDFQVKPGRFKSFISPSNGGLLKRGSRIDLELQPIGVAQQKLQNVVLTESTTSLSYATSLVDTIDRETEVYSSIRDEYSTHSIKDSLTADDLPNIKSPEPAEIDGLNHVTSLSHSVTHSLLGTGDASIHGSDFQSETTSLIGAGKKGVYVKVKGSHVQLQAEKGTRVPNIMIREINLEVECSLSVLFEFSEKLGWVSRGGLKFEVLQLKKESVGNSIPLPSTLVKTLLNLILPKIVERALLSMLPKELGTYLIKSERGMIAAGEIVFMGPPLCTVHAKLDTPIETNSSKPLKANILKTYSAVQEAQNLLSLSPRQAKLLGICFSREYGLKLLDSHHQWSGQCTIHELCTFYDHYSKSEAWLAMCDLWNKAIRYILSIKGSDLEFDFAHLMNGIVARLAAKPVRTHFLLTRLSCHINVDFFISCFKDYSERRTKELHAEKSDQVVMPLHEQLRKLEKWNVEVHQKLESFKLNFKSFLAAFIAHGNCSNLQLGLDKVQYEGPLSFQLPVVRDLEKKELLSCDISIPSPADSKDSKFIDGLYRAIRAIHTLQKTAINSTSPEGSKSELESRVQWGEGHDIGERLMQAILQNSKKEVSLEAESDQSSIPIGKFLLKHLKTSVTLNEETLAKELFSSGKNGANGLYHMNQLKTIIRRLSDVVMCDLAHDEADMNQYRLKFQSSDFARIKCQVDTLGFLSSVSPAEIISILHIFLREYALLFYGAKSAQLKSLDHILQQLVKYVDKRSLDVILSTKVQSFISDQSLVVSVSELEGLENKCPVQITNDFDIMSLVDSLKHGPGNLDS